MREADIVVIGSGPGGAITASLLAEAGRQVLLLEEGSHLSMDSCPAFSQQELIQKYRNGGVTVALGNPKVAYVEGRCVGGGSEINSGLYHRTPAETLAAWRSDYGLAGTESLDAYFDTAERDVSVSLMPHEAPPASLRLSQGANALGWQAIEVPRWYKYDAASGRKQSMTETFVPRFLQAGGHIEAQCRVNRLERQGDTWLIHVFSPSDPRNRRVIRARNVFLCAGAIHTPTLLRRSRLAPLAGKSLRLHATAKATALFGDTVNSDGMGVPVHQVKEFSPKISLGCSISSIPYLHLALMDVKGADALVADSWQRMAIYYAMVQDGVGSIHPLPGLSDPLVRFSLGKEGIQNIMDGLAKLCECLFAAGANAVFPSVVPGVALTSMRQVRELAATLKPSQLNLMTIHLMGSCPMGERRDLCVADSYGKVFGHTGLYVNDSSMIPTALGVNPQGTVMALAMRNAQAFLENR